MTGDIRPVEQEILHRVFEFGELSIAELMTPEPDIFSINLLTPWPELVRSLQESGHSRVPVWQGSPNNIVGTLLVKRLLALVATQRSGGTSRTPSPRQIHKLLHAPRFVSRTKAADELLSEFQARRSHMAIVVEEHGDVVGVITLDDLLNELVGEMFDETDKENPAVTPIEGQSWQIHGSMPITDFSERFHLPIPEGDYDTLGQLVMAVAETPPVAGECVEWNGARFTVDQLTGADIRLVTVELEQAYEEDDPTQESPDPQEERS
jgi:CBS domain containing-hemolysin-like protein